MFLFFLECNCNLAGAKEVPGYPLGGCGEVIQGHLCECKERVICDIFLFLLQSVTVILPEPRRCRATPWEAVVR